VSFTRLSTRCEQVTRRLTKVSSEGCSSVSVDRRRSFQTAAVLTWDQAKCMRHLMMRRAVLHGIR
jgi:hypothetical protein